MRHFTSQAQLYGLIITAAACDKTLHFTTLRSPVVLVFPHIIVLRQLLRALLS
jgi:uncharacterized protein (DUF952 family)